MYEKIINFIKDLYQTGEKVSLHAPCFLGNEKKYLNDCIDTTFVSSVGAYVDRFEQLIGDYTGAGRAVVCVNGTNALHISLMLVGVEREDEVLTQPLTFIATCNALSYIGAKPVFIDVDLDTLGMSPKATRIWLENNAKMKNGVPYNKHSRRKIKACLPMHTFGHPIHLNEMIEVCNEWNIKLVEDAAESIGSLYYGKHTGVFGTIGALSFNGNKTITTGGGGMMLFQDPELGAYAKHITTQAKVSHKWAFVHDHIGYNYRMPNINAALGCAQFENLDRFIEDKRNTAHEYAEFFKNIEGIKFFTEPEGCRSNYWLNVIILENKDKQQEFLKETNDAGVQTRPVWELMPRLSMFKDCETDGIKNAIWLADRIVNIPSGVRLKK